VEEHSSDLTAKLPLLREDMELLSLHLVDLTKPNRSWLLEGTFQKGLTLSACLGPSGQLPSKGISNCAESLCEFILRVHLCGDPLPQTHLQEVQDGRPTDLKG
jgi:hypothetical protein